jgi:hypothetical protein
VTRPLPVVLLLLVPALAPAQEAPPPAPRIESEWKLDVPRGQDEAVWAYLQRRYGAGEGSLLPELGAGFSATFSDEDFVDDYFDDTRFSLLRLEAGLRHRGRWFDEDVTHRKHGRELLQLEGAGAQVRTELEWPVRPLDHEWRGEPDENVPGLQLVTRGDRDEVRAALAAMGVDASDLVQVLQLPQRRRCAYIARDGSAYATVTLDQARPRKLWWSTSFTEIELELSEIRYTEASEQERAAMEAVNDRIAQDLMREFPGIRRDQTPNYNKAFALLEAEAWAFRPAIVIGLPLPLLGLLVLSSGALVVVAARRQAASFTRWR